MTPSRCHDATASCVEGADKKAPNSGCSWSRRAVDTARQASDDMQYGRNGAHRLVSCTITAFSQVSAQIPDMTGSSPRVALARVGGNLLVQSILPLVKIGLADRCLWQPGSETGNLPRWKRRIVAGAALALPWLLRNVGHFSQGLSIDTAGVAAQTAVLAGSQRAGVDSHHVIHQAAWVIAEGARLGVALGMQYGERYNVEREVAKALTNVQKQVASDWRSLNSLGAPGDTPLALTCFAGTHLSDSFRPSRFEGSAAGVPNKIFSNQQKDIAWQLQNNLRLFSLEFYKGTQQMLVSSHNRWYSFGSLMPTLNELGEFLDHHPHEILALKLSDQDSFRSFLSKNGSFLAGTEALEATLKSSRLAKHLTTIWGVRFNTLSEIVQRGKRAILLADDLEQTSFSELTTPAIGRYRPDGPPTYLNAYVHPRISNFFLTFPLPMVSQAANKRMREYFDRDLAQGRVPNFVIVNDASTSRAAEYCLEQNRAGFVWQGTTIEKDVVFFD